MKRVIFGLVAALALSGCMSGTPANNGLALTSSQAAFVGDWSGKLPSGKPVRIVISPAGGVSYYFQNRAQSLTNVKVTSSQASMTVGNNGSTARLSSSGAYVFVWGPTGETTRATLTKQ